MSTHIMAYKNEVLFVPSSPMDTGDEVVIFIPGFIRGYKDGRIDRLAPGCTETIPPSLDPLTGVTSKDIIIDPETGVSARLYLPDAVDPDEKLPVLVYYHGGGFCIESAKSPLYHPYLNSITARARLVAVSVDYRLAPEHPIPAAYDDAWLALRWVASAGDDWLIRHADLRRIFVAGDSAGGNIAHNVALRAGETPDAGVELEGMVLVQPFFSKDEARVKASTMVDMLWSFVCPGAKPGEEDGRLNPMAGGRLAGIGCRRAMVAVAEKDMGREMGTAYFEGLRGSGWGGAAEIVMSEGVDHVFHLFNPATPRALELMDWMVTFFNS